MRNSVRFTIAILLAGSFLVNPQSFADKKPKPPKIFSDSSEMDVILAGPWERIADNKKVDAFYPVQLTYPAADGTQHTIDAKVAPRALTRRRICDFPPLKIHFDKDKLKGTEFRGNKSLKLVTYCDTNMKYQQYYVKEFLVYQIYNLITDYSFRAKPMMITYQDTEESDDPVIRFGFLIEDTDDMAERSDMEQLSLARVPYRQLDALTTSHQSVFQFMIGNVDWAATDGPEDDACCHNTKLIGAGDAVNPKYSVPYDFDSSGLVNAHYAYPPPGLKLRNIRQRLYRGFCAFKDQLPASTQLFNEKKPEILALFNDNPHLTDKMRKAAVKYIGEFYDILNNPKKFKKNITDKCRGKG